MPEPLTVKVCPIFSPPLLPAPPKGPAGSAVKPTVSEIAWNGNIARKPKTSAKLRMRTRMREVTTGWIIIFIGVDLIGLVVERGVDLEFEAIELFCWPDNWLVGRRR